MPDEPSRPSRIGIALAGGVAEGGFYEVGVLCALEEAIEGLDCTRLDAYVGVSAGAVVASMLANGIPPRRISRVIVAEADPALDVDLDILFTPALGEYAHRVARIPGTLARWLRRRIERPMDVSLVGSLLELGALMPAGLFDGGPLERYLARVFASEGRTNDFRRLRAPLRVVAVNLDTSELVGFGDDATAHVPISRAVQASAALPGLYCPVEIDGQHFIDGVARRTLNASVALDAGVDLLLCVNPIVPVDLRAAGARRGGGLVEHGLPGVLSQTLRTMVHSRMRTAFRGYSRSHPHADLLLIEPSLGDQRMFFSNIFSTSKRREVCEHAYASTRAHLRESADAWSEVLERHGLRLRRDALADPARRLFDGLPERRAAATSALGDALDRLARTLDRLSA